MNFRLASETTVNKFFTSSKSAGDTCFHWPKVDGNEDSARRFSLLKLLRESNLILVKQSNCDAQQNLLSKIAIDLLSNDDVSLLVLSSDTLIKEQIAIGHPHVIPTVMNPFDSNCFQFNPFQYVIDPKDLEYITNVCMHASDYDGTSIPHDQGLAAEFRKKAWGLLTTLCAVIQSEEGQDRFNPRTICEYLDNGLPYLEKLFKHSKVREKYQASLEYIDLDICGRTIFNELMIRFGEFDLPRLRQATELSNLDLSSLRREPSIIEIHLKKSYLSSSNLIVPSLLACGALVGLKHLSRQASKSHVRPIVVLIDDLPLFIGRFPNLDVFLNQLRDIGIFVLGFLNCNQDTPATSFSAELLAAIPAKGIVSPFGLQLNFPSLLESHETFRLSQSEMLEAFGSTLLEDEIFESQNRVTFLLPAIPPFQARLI